MSSFDTKNYGFSFGSILIFAGSPLLLSGQYIWGGLCIVLALVIRASKATSGSNEVEAPLTNFSPGDLLEKLNQIAESAVDSNVAKSKNKSSDTLYVADEETRINLYVEGLSILGRKYNKSNHKDKLSLQYQELSFKLICLHPKNDQVVAGSISLLALVAKNAMVRERFIHQSDDYGLNRPIYVLKKVIQRAREEEDESKEAFLAEILRKGCLFLGAISSDGQNLGLPSIIVSEGGLELILEAANWFRLHEDVSNWALWAIFTLCYDNLSIKAELVRSKGIQVICRLMKNNPTSLEVNRHGTALLFDLMRENHEENTGAWNPWEVRKIAIASGLHNLVLSAMNEFSDSTDIVMMGQEILVGTNYRGEVPKYKQG